MIFLISNGKNMLNHKHYMNIDNLKIKSQKKFHKGDDIIIQEKIDGSNASFQYNKDDDCLDCFSRNQPLSKENNLRGFYEWVQKLDKNKVREVLGDNLRMFGEWLVPHKVQYPEECYNQLYCFDVFDMENKIYLPQSEVKILAEKLGIRYVPVFYEGKFTEWNDYMSLVGKTEMGSEIGEGIVIKNMSSLCDDVAYTKIVHEKFVEVQHHKTKRIPNPVDKEKMLESQRLRELAKTIVTYQRVEKMLFKLIDEGIIPENFSKSDMGTILKNLPSAVYHDCLKEEPEIVGQIENFGKYSGNITIGIIKTILDEKESKG